MGTVFLCVVIPAIEPDIVIAQIVVVIQLEAKSELRHIRQVDVWECPAIQQSPNTTR